jgi:hypothetical protein
MIFQTDDAGSIRASPSRQLGQCSDTLTATPRQALYRWGSAMDQIDRPGSTYRAALGAFCGAVGGMFGLVLAILALPIVLVAIYLTGWLIHF